MSSEAEPPPAPDERSPGRDRRTFLTPEQRRFLGTPRSRSEREQVANAAASAPEVSPAAPEQPAAIPVPAPPDESHEPAVAVETPPSAEPEERTLPPSADLQKVVRAARAVELRTALLIIGGLVLVAMAFYAGKQFNYIRYLIASKKRDAALEQVAQKYPGVSSEELITTALAARKRGDWSEAVDRLLAAKRNNPTLPGLLFLIGKTSFDRGELDTADLAFSHAIRFNENVAASSYHRGLIALRRQDTGAAIRYFEAAAEAEPFISDTYFSWGEALRLDGRARDAIRRYEQAEQRSTRAEDSTLCAFKIRLARIEAGDAAAVAAEIEQRGDAGARSVDWLMTDAALHLHRGMTADAARLISEARALGLPAIFLTCAADHMFRKAAETHEEVRAALRTVAVPQ